MGTTTAEEHSLLPITSVERGCGDCETRASTAIAGDSACKTLPHYGKALKQVLDQVHLRIDVNISIDRLSNSQVTGIYVENLKDLDPREEFRLLIQAPLAALSKIYAKPENTPPTLKVLLIDSLDEAATTTGQENMVTLLAALYQARETLPSWVRFLFTAHPDQAVLDRFLPLQSQKIEELEEKNLSDIKRYIQGRVDDQLIGEQSTPKPQVSNAVVTNQKPLKQRLEEADTTANKLVNEVKELSKGNFLYTKLLLNSIVSGEQSIKNLSDLPRTLNDIYHRILRYRCSFRGWLKRYQPILGTLSVAQEPITQEQLSKFISSEIEGLSKDLNVFRQFLDEAEDEQGQKLYSIFHQSLREYLLDRKNNHDFWCDAKEQHDNIIECFERESKEWQDLREIDLYGLRHLAQHLVRASRVEDLHQLLNREKDGRNAWFDAKDRVAETASFLADITLAWNHVNRAFDNRPEETIGLQCHYALTMTSVNSLFRQIPGNILLALVEHSINNIEGFLWSSLQSLTYARQMPNSAGKAKLLAKISLHVPNPLKQQISEEVLAIVQTIRDSSVLQGLVSYVPETERERILQIALMTAKEKTPEKDRVRSLVELTPLLAESQRYEAFQEAVSSISGIKRGNERIQELSRLVPVVPESLLEELLETVRVCSEYPQENEDMVLNFLTGDVHQNEFYLSSALQQIAERLHDLKRSEVLQEALDLARKVEKDWDRIRLLIRLVPNLQEPLKDQLLNEALWSARAVRHGWYRALLLNQLTPNLSGSLKDKVLNETLTSMLTFSPEPLRSKVLDELDSTTPVVQDSKYQAQAEVLARAVNDLQSAIISDSSKAEILQKIVTTVLEIKDERIFQLIAGSDVWTDPGLNDFMQIKVIAAIIPFLPEVQRKATLTVALKLARGIEVNPILFEASQKRALDFVNDGATYRVDALTLLAPLFEEPEQTLIFEEAIRNIYSIKYTLHLRKALNTLATHLPDSLKHKILEIAKGIKSVPLKS
jgi:hypothetical protein